MIFDFKYNYFVKQKLSLKYNYLICKYTKRNSMEYNILTYWNILDLFTSDYLLKSVNFSWKKQIR